MSATILGRPTPTPLGKPRPVSRPSQFNELKLGETLEPTARTIGDAMARVAGRDAWAYVGTGGGPGGPSLTFGRGLTQMGSSVTLDFAGITSPLIGGIFVPSAAAGLVLTPGTGQLALAAATRTQFGGMTFATEAEIITGTLDTKAVSPASLRQAVPDGGTVGQVLAKTGPGNRATSWQTVAVGGSPLIPGRGLTATGDTWNLDIAGVTLADLGGVWIADGGGAPFSVDGNGLLTLTPATLLQVAAGTNATRAVSPQGLRDQLGADAAILTTVAKTVVPAINELMLAINFDLYRGIWEVGNNTPPLNPPTPPPVNGDRWLCVTADPNVPETAPANMPGVGGTLIHNGSYVIWDAGVPQWGLLAAGSLSKAEADTLYLSLQGGTLSGPLTINDDAYIAGNFGAPMLPSAPEHLANKEYVDAALAAGGTLPLTFGLGLTQTGDTVDLDPAGVIGISLGGVFVPLPGTSGLAVSAAGQLTLSPAEAAEVASGTLNTRAISPLGLRSEMGDAAANLITTAKQVIPAINEIVAATAAPLVPGRGLTATGDTWDLDPAGMAPILLGGVYVPPPITSGLSVGAGTGLLALARATRLQYGGMQMSTEAEVAAGAIDNKAISPLSLRSELGAPAATLNTTVKTIVPAINELVATITQDHYRGTWEVAANLPPLNPPVPPAANGDRWLCVTANSNVGEGAPAGMPGITAGQIIHNGSYVIWDERVGIWDILSAGGLSVAEADTRYLSLLGGTLDGPLTINDDAAITGTFFAPAPPTEDEHLANKAYVDAALGGVGTTLIPGRGLTATGDTWDLNPAGQFAPDLGGVHVPPASFSGLEISGPDGQLSLSPATIAEVQAGTLNTRAVSPQGLRSELGAAAATLATTQKTVVPAINELHSAIGAVGGPYLPLSGGSLTGAIDIHIPAPGGNPLVSLSSNAASAHAVYRAWHQGNSYWDFGTIGQDYVVVDRNGSSRTILRIRRGAGAVTIDNPLEVTGNVISVLAPAAPDHLTNKRYVDDTVGGQGPFLPLSGGAMNNGAAVSFLNGGITTLNTLTPLAGATQASNAECMVSLASGGSPAWRFGPVDGDYVFRSAAAGDVRMRMRIAYTGGSPANVTDRMVTIYAPLTVTDNVASPPPPTDPDHLTNKRYVDLTLADAGSYQGGWQVGTNTPDLNPPTPAPGRGYRWLCLTVDQDVPEPAPPGMPGIGGVMIYGGSSIVWDDARGTWDLIVAGNLGKAEADTLYLALAGGVMAGTLRLASDPGAPMEAATQNYVDTLRGDVDDLRAYVDAQDDLYLPLVGGALSGPLTLAADPVDDMEAVTRRYVDDTVGGQGPFLALAGGTMLGYITLLDDPTFALEAATKRYVDAQDALYLPLTGGVMTGPMTLAADPAADMEPATRQYVDAAGVDWAADVAAAYLPLVGGELTGPLALSRDPVNANEPVTKSYLDAIIASGDVYQGAWQVGANIPDLRVPPHVPQSGHRYLCTTVDPIVAEVAPIGMPGVAGRGIYNGSFIVWDNKLSQWDLIAIAQTGGLSQDLADTLYVNRLGDEMTGDLTVRSSPTNGALRLRSGPADRTGLIEFIRPNGVRAGYIGWALNSNNRINFQPEAGSAFQFHGEFFCTSITMSNRLSTTDHVVVTGATGGSVRLDGSGGAAGRSGFVGFHTPDGVRRGYVGYATNNRIELQAEGSYVYHFNKWPTFPGAAIIATEEYVKERVAEVRTELTARIAQLESRIGTHA
jgi:hypothetical protein